MAVQLFWGVASCLYLSSLFCFVRFFCVFKHCFCFLRFAFVHSGSSLFRFPFGFCLKARESAPEAQDPPSWCSQVMVALSVSSIVSLAIFIL